MWRKYDQTACIPVRNQTWIIQCPKRAVSEWKFVTNWDQFSDKLQSWDSASFIPNERSISEVHLSVVIFISTPSHTYYRATFQDLSKILWIHVNSHRAKRSREGIRDSAYLAHYPHCVLSGPWPLYCYGARSQCRNYPGGGGALPYWRCRGRAAGKGMILRSSRLKQGV